jgi:hypothetical protein
MTARRWMGGNGFGGIVAASDLSPCVLVEGLGQFTQQHFRRSRWESDCTSVILRIQ